MVAAIIPPEKGEAYKKALLNQLRRCPDLEKAAQWLAFFWKTQAHIWWVHKPADAPERWVVSDGEEASVSPSSPGCPPRESLQSFLRRPRGIPGRRPCVADFDG